MTLPTTAVLEGLARQAGLESPSIVLRRLGAIREGSLAGERPGVTSGFETLLDADRELAPASMIKTPLATALAALWESGAVDREGRTIVTSANMTANDAESPLGPGYDARFDELATLMLARSDNVATNVLIDVVGRARANEFAHRIGLTATTIRRKLSGSLPLIDDAEATGRNAHPARDAAALFEAIADRRVPGADWLHAMLLAQEWNTKLSRGLAPDDRFAHKTGDTDEASHDGGILESAEGERYVIVVYTSLASSPASDARLADFMRALRPLL